MKDRVFSSNRRLGVESLEARRVLAAVAVGEAFPLSDFVSSHQRLAESADNATELASGNFAAAYEGRGVVDREGVFVGFTDAAGRATGSSIRLNQTLKGAQRQAALAALPGGGFVAVWSGRGRGDHNGVYVRLFDAQGAPQSDEILANATIGGIQQEPSAAVRADGSFTVVWSGVGEGDDQGVFLRRFSAAGVPQAGEVLVNTTTIREQQSPRIAIAADGSETIVWSGLDSAGQAGVFGRRFDSAGNPRDSEFSLQEQSATTFGKTALAGRDDGRFLAVWSGWDGASWNVSGRLFDAAGAAASSEIDIAASGPIRPAPQAEIRSDGQFTVAWSAAAEGARDADALARQFDAAGTPLAEAFSLSEAVFGPQQAPALAMNSRGDFAAFWSSYDATDRFGVSARWFAEGSPVNELNLETIPDQLATVDQLWETTVDLAGFDPGGNVTFLLDPESAALGIGIEKQDSDTARLFWTPAAGEEGSYEVIVLVSDDSSPPQVDSERFTLTVATGSGEGEGEGVCRAK